MLALRSDSYGTDEGREKPASSQPRQSRATHPSQDITSAIHPVEQGLLDRECRGTSLKTNAPPSDPTVGLCLGSLGGPRGVGVSYEQGTPVNDSHFVVAPNPEVTRG